MKTQEIKRFLFFIFLCYHLVLPMITLGVSSTISSTMDSNFSLSGSQVTTPPTNVTITTPTATILQDWIHVNINSIYDNKENKSLTVTGSSVTFDNSFTWGIQISVPNYISSAVVQQQTINNKTLFIKSYVVEYTLVVYSTIEASMYGIFSAPITVDVADIDGVYDYVFKADEFYEGQAAKTITFPNYNFTGGWSTFISKASYRTFANVLLDITVDPTSLIGVFAQVLDVPDSGNYTYDTSLSPYARVKSIVAKAATSNYLEVSVDPQISLPTIPSSDLQTGTLGDVTPVPATQSDTHSGSGITASGGYISSTPKSPQPTRGYYDLAGLGSGSTIPATVPTTGVNVVPWYLVGWNSAIATSDLSTVRASLPYYIKPEVEIYQTTNYYKSEEVFVRNNWQNEYSRTTNHLNSVVTTNGIVINNRWIKQPFIVEVVVGAYYDWNPLPQPEVIQNIDIAAPVGNRSADVFDAVPIGSLRTEVGFTGWPELLAAFFQGLGIWVIIGIIAAIIIIYIIYKVYKSYTRGGTGKVPPSIGPPGL
jgi:hypothetical protein